MRKIPTLYARDPATNLRHVRDELVPGCEWVIAGEGVATRKYDGTCVLVAVDGVFARREVKPGKNAPPGWWETDHDEVTGKRVGWQPAGDSAFAKFIAEALATGDKPVGTYELCGPKVNGNPEGFPDHRLVSHAAAEVLLDVPTDFDGLAAMFSADDWKFEGVVWHHPDGRMAKIKRRDFV